MKSFVTTVVGGAIGLIALYVVGRVAYTAGKQMAQAEQHYKEMCEKTEKLTAKQNSDGDGAKPDEGKPMPAAKDKPARKHKRAGTDEATAENTQNRSAGETYKGRERRSEPVGKLGLMFLVRRWMDKKESVISRLVHNPEAHCIEAFVEGNEIKLNVRPKIA